MPARLSLSVDIFFLSRMNVWCRELERERERVRERERENNTRIIKFQSHSFSSAKREKKNHLHTGNCRVHFLFTEQVDIRCSAPEKATGRLMPASWLVQGYKPGSFTETTERILRLLGYVLEVPKDEEPEFAWTVPSDEEERLLTACLNVVSLTEGKVTRIGGANESVTKTVNFSGTEALNLGLCASIHGLQNSMKAILAWHPCIRRITGQGVNFVLTLAQCHIRWRFTSQPLSLSFVIPFPFRFHHSHHTSRYYTDQKSRDS